MTDKNSLRPRKQPRQARSRATVDAILEGAAQVFCRDGYAAGTTDKVAERAGVSIGSLYQYFPNKDALLLALANKHAEEGFLLVQGLLAETVANPPPLRILLRRFVEALMALHAHEPALHRVLFNEAPLPAIFFERKEQQEYEFSIKVSVMLSAHEEVCCVEPNVGAYMLVQTIEGLVHGFILFPPKTIDADTFTDEIVTMLYQYLTFKRE